MVKFKEMEKKYNNVAVITARGGSKRIPRKNIKDFMGKPMIAHAIETAKKSGLFSEIMVSTEDQEIADIARKFGASVPFMRSLNTANDIATTFDVLDEVVSQYEEKGQVFDNLCCIYPCVPPMILIRLFLLYVSHSRFSALLLPMLMDYCPTENRSIKISDLRILSQHITMRECSTGIAGVIFPKLRSMRYW